MAVTNSYRREGFSDPSHRLSTTSIEQSAHHTTSSGADLTRITTGDSTIDFPPSSLDVELSTASDGVPPSRADSTFVAVPAVHPSPVANGTPNRSSVYRPTKESPIKPAAEVFAFLLEPRKPKSSTSTIDPIIGSRTDIAPPVPPKGRASLAQELPIVPIRTGSSGIPRHPYFGSTTSRPSAAQQGRNRSHSASAADVLAQSPAVRRSATFVMPNLVPHGPRPGDGSDSTRPASRAGMSAVGTMSPVVERKRPATALGFDETFGDIDPDTDVEEDAAAPVAPPSSRIPVFKSAATPKERPTSGVIRSSSVGPATALWAASPREHPVVRASSVGPSACLGETPSKSTNRPASGILRPSSLGPSDLLASTSSKPAESQVPKLVRASSVGPTAALNLKSPKTGTTRHHRSSSVGAASTLNFGNPSARPMSHRRTSSSADTSTMTDAPELAEVQQAIRGTRTQVLRPEARRLPAPSNRQTIDKENAGFIPRATVRATSPGLDVRMGHVEEVLVTPARPFTTLRSPPVEENAPSPSLSSSIDLSPVGKELMANIREQRMRVREKEKV